ncbi:MAG: hypothetical protein ACLP4V_01590 [Methylocella sp.]
MAKWDLPTDPILAVKVVEHEARKGERSQEMGLMGRIFGFASEKPGNIAGFLLIVFSCVFCLELVWGVDSPSLSKKDALSLIGGFITLTIGFVFGHTTSAAKE